MSRSSLFTTLVPPDFLRDESRKVGTAEAIAFPKTTEDVVTAMREASERGLAVTVQGSRTGISAGAVPDNGVIISLARMDRVLGFRISEDGQALLRIQPGLTLSTLRRYLASALCPPSSALRPPTLMHSHTNALTNFPPPSSALRPLASFFFPPDPTETSASLGGMAACNASGACSFAYGPMRNHIEGLTIVLAEGDVLTLRRGQDFATGRHFSLTTDNGRLISGELPAYVIPSVKSAAGYWVKPDMDLLDLFIGNEGTLGIIAELELRLRPAPFSTLGVLCFLEDEAQVLDLVASFRDHATEASPHTLVALEYFDGSALRLIPASTPSTGLRLPPSKPHWTSALYVEWALAEPSDMPATLTCQLLAAGGGHPDDTWVATEASTLDKLKAFRHAIPEQINAIIADRKRGCPSLTKLGTDLSVPDDKLPAIMSRYRGDLSTAGLEHVIFGHIGNNHVHVNILPRDMAEYATGKQLYQAWAKQVVAWGGSVSAEHGIGRLKKELLAIMVGADGIAGMRQLKTLFDPQHRLGPGTLF